MSEPSTPLPSPGRLRARLAAPGPVSRLIARTRAEIAAALRGEDARLLVVVGPCSLHDAESAIEYASRLQRLAEATRERLIVVMRSYFEKPRTTIGWKGLINDPRLDGSCDVAHGLVLARELLLAINGLGVPCGSEVLDPLTPHYLGDLLSWAAIGARTSESQTHRELASRLEMPVGFKNGTEGGLASAADAMLAAGQAHSFLGIDDEGRIALCRSLGNPHRHVVLRGGASGPNFAREHVLRAAARVAAQGFARPVLVDCSHDNSGKDPGRQGSVCRAVIAQTGRPSPLLGVLLESHLREGRQAFVAGAQLEYGVSITDGCIGWEETEKLLFELASASKARERAGTLAPA